VSVFSITELKNIAILTVLLSAISYHFMEQYTLDWYWVISLLAVVALTIFLVFVMTGKSILGQSPRVEITPQVSEKPFRKTKRKSRRKKNSRLR